jgi:hypothetical protein
VPIPLLGIDWSCYRTVVVAGFGRQESKIVEFKECCADSSLEGIAVFANYGDGALCVRVRDDGKVGGCTVPDAGRQ